MRGKVCWGAWFILILLLITSTARAQDHNPFGVVEGFWQPEQVCALGVGWERIIFDWAQHQPTGADDWHTLNVDDRWLKAANACGREVVAIVKHTPAWATDGIPGAGVPRGLTLPIDNPDNLWANFMRRAAHYYASRGVRRFIIWNEPDIDRETYGYEFEGSLEDYHQLLRVGALAARQGNPDAQIHLAGTTYWHDVNQGRRLYLDRLLERISADPDAAANGHYFDVLTLHIYFRADTVYTITREMRDLLARYGMANKAIWITETNASPNLDPLWRVERPIYQITLEQQTSFLWQAAALGLAAGADHIGVYKFYDVDLPAGAESFGLLRADGSARPAFAAYQQIIALLSDVETAALAQTPTVNVVRLSRRDGTEIYAAWARTAEPTQIVISATGTKAQIGSEYGNMMRIRPVNGTYTLLLPGADCNPDDGCAVGGAVTVLAQPTGAAQLFEVVNGAFTELTFG